MPNIIVILKEGSDAKEIIGRPGAGMSAVGTKAISKRVIVIPMNNVTDDYLAMLQCIPEVESIDLALRAAVSPEPNWEYMATISTKLASDVATLCMLIGKYKPKEKH